ncbi:MAG: OFA family MFS transporter [Planctomycetia bacterium]|nr:OFA family MFS transporter [Planctomycetia bacterium]
MSQPGFFSRERIVAPADFNRWRIPPASIAIHLCIGAAYAWSIFNPALMRIRGVVVPAADDWKLPQVVWVFTVAIVCLGLSAAVAGKWLERVGPRTVGVVAAFLWSGGYLLGSLGIAAHQLWLLYLGYGVIGGCGLGLGYVSPVSTLIKWFPDRRGMAAGMAIMGFGGGAILAAPLQERLMQSCYEAPQYLGRATDVALITEAGRRFATIAGERREVVVVGAKETAQMVVPGPEGVYVVGTGDVGIAATFLTLGAAYLVIMLAAALSFRVPAAGWRPAGWVPRDDATAAARMIAVRDVDPDAALRTPQFYLLWIMLCFNVTAGIGVLGVAKTMMTEIFGSALPAIVDSRFAATYVLMIGVFNMLGRFFWASMSDLLGRKRTYAIFFGVGAALYAAIPSIVGRESPEHELAPLVLFYGVTMLIFTMYGGGFATIPAYLADLFGARNVGAIHGRLLTAWSTAGVLGPWAITALRQHSEKRAIEALANVVSPDKFAERFGAPLADLPLLVERKTVTLAKLFELAPLGTLDPSRSLYDSTMYLMAGLLVIGFVADMLVRPVAAKHLAPMK